MTLQRSAFIRSRVLTCFLVLLMCAAAHAQRNKYACSEPNPQSLCNAGNTCGSGSDPCTVDVKRDNYGASATAGISNAKANGILCVKSGTTIIWKTTQKNTGFVIDFGTPSPFGSEDAITGGAKRPASVTAMKAGCYKYSVGACISGAIQGMCGSSTAEAVILASGSN
jgi:hypothetical protein